MYSSSSAFFWIEPSSVETRHPLYPLLDERNLVKRCFCICKYSSFGLTHHQQKWELKNATIFRPLFWARETLENIKFVFVFILPSFWLNHQKKRGWKDIWLPINLVSSHIHCTFTKSPYQMLSCCWEYICTTYNVHTHFFFNITLLIVMS